MTSSSYFFRVEHDLLRSEAFKTLGGSAIKVYLVIGLYSDFGTDWAYPSIRTIASPGRPQPPNRDCRHPTTHPIRYPRDK